MSMGPKSLATPILTFVGLFQGIGGDTTNKENQPTADYNGIEQVNKLNQNPLSKKDIPSVFEILDSIKSQIFVCLETDDENSFTYTKTLESIEDSENTVLELPIAQLFQKYGGKKHPLYVKGVPKNFRALVGRNGIETELPQGFSSHEGIVTDKTAYLITDTLRFSLINPKIKDDFSENLWDQLQEPGFERFSDSENLAYSSDDTENTETYYDIVVKKVPSGKSALALYKNGKLFMATYVSVGLQSKQTRTGQFKIKGSYPYRRSIKYDDAPMPFALNYSGGYFFHQGNVTGRPTSHGCVRLPGVYAFILYSLVNGKLNTDVFIDTNLYKVEK